MLRFLIDRSIQLGMDEPSRDSYYLLDEIEHLEVPIKRLGELTNVGWGTVNSSFHFSPWL